MRPTEDKDVTPVFLHLDLDQFFVSAERLRDPSLFGKAVCVGGADPTARGAIACASYEAREHGVYAGQALRRAKALCPQAIFVSGSPELYVDLSRTVRRLLVERTPRVIPRSIDEFDIDLTGCERLLGDLTAYARSLQQVVRDETGLPNTMGMAAAPLVAKVAAGEHKPEGFHRVPWGDEAAFLAPLDIRKLPGVGPRTEERLLELGVRTIGELAALDADPVREALGNRGLELHARAHGGPRKLAPERPGAGSFAHGWALGGFGGAQAEEAARATTTAELLPRSLSRARTFAEDQDERRLLDAALVRLVENATAALRVRKLRARTLTVSVRYADLRDVSRSRRLPREAEENAVLTAARALLEQLLQRRLRLRRLGVAFHGLSLAYEQLRLFEGPQARSQRALGLALDRVRERHGYEAVRFGGGLGAGDPSQAG
jgi:DNA polymerase-4